MTAFDDWLQDNAALRIFLVELQALKLADESTVTLYLSTHPFYHTDRQYIPCVAEIPSIDCQGGDVTDPAYLPTYGDLVIHLEPEFAPDQDRAITWNLLLYKDDYNFQGQAVTVFLGGEGMAYGDFATIFTGFVGDVRWSDNSLTLAIYDKLKQLDIQIPSFDLPDSVFINQESWGATLPLPLGLVQHYAPIFLSTLYNGIKYVLAGGVINSIQAVYLNEIAIDPMFYQLNQKDISPAAKDAYGSFSLDTYGPYTGSATVQEWLIQIDSVATGTEIGQATFRWSLDNGATWEAENVLTWSLAYNPATLQMITSEGSDMAVIIGGTYTGTEELNYQIKITLGGTPGTIPYPKFAFSEDGGATWSADINISSAGPFSLSHGLTVTFSDTAVITEVSKTEGACTPHAEFYADGGISTIAVTVEILDDGIIGTDWIDYRWTNDGGANWNTGNITPQVREQTDNLFDDVYVTFRTAGECFNNGDTYDIVTTPAGNTLVVDDIWEFVTNLKSSIPLADGVSILFISESGQDFYLWDEARFILYSTLDVYLSLTTPTTGSILVSLYGLRNSAGTCPATAGDLIMTLPKLFAGWTDDDFDLTSFSDFNAIYTQTLGKLVDSPMAMTDIFKDLLTGFPAIYSTTREGKFFLKELSAPSGSATLTLTDNDFFQYPESSLHLDNSVIKRVLFRFDKNYSVNNNPASSLDQAWIEWISKDLRQVSARDERIRQTYPLAVDVGPLETALINRSEAQALARSFLDLFRTPREYFEAVISLRGILLELGDLVEVQRASFGLDSGELFVVVGTDLDCQQGEVRLTLWR